MTVIDGAETPAGWLGKPWALEQASARARGELLLLRPALALCGLLLVQLGLGAATWVTHYGFPSWLSGYSWAAGYTVVAKSPLQIHLTTAHVACGSLIFATAVILAVRSLRLLQAEPRASIAGGKLAGAAA